MRDKDTKEMWIFSSGVAGGIGIWELIECVRPDDSPLVVQVVFGLLCVLVSLWLYTRAARERFAE